MYNNLDFYFNLQGMFRKIVGLWFSSKGKNAKDVQKYIKELVLSWANEFFTGYNPPYWYEKFWFEVSPNGRFSEHEQITDLETLKTVVAEVHIDEIEIFLNLNAWYYTDETMPFIQKMVTECIEAWVDGIICGNIWILEYLKEIWYQWKINISTILAVYNKSAISFFLENYRINKVILSRELTLKEIESLVLAFPAVLFEVFWEGDFCRYNNGLCFAEHKYSSRDICTVVVNDLILKKRYHPNFKKIILDTNITELQKLELLSDTYENIFEEIEGILEKCMLWMGDTNTLIERLGSILFQAQKRVDMYYDALKSMKSEHNKNIVSVLKWLKYFLHSEKVYTLDQEKKEVLEDFRNELEKSVKTWMEYLSQKIKELSGEEKIKALELKQFYSKGDLLNLHSYLFFSQFKNIQTVKFPTRWRSASEKLALIESVVVSWKVDDSYIDRGASIERAHYDLSYLFWEKLWFRKIIAQK